MTDDLAKGHTVDRIVAQGFRTEAGSGATQHPADSFEEMRRVCVCGRVVERGRRLTGTVPSLDQDPPRADRARQLHIGPAIAYHNRPLQRQIQIRSRLIEHPRLWLVTRTAAAIGLQGGVRQVWAIVVPVQLLSHLRELALHEREGIMDDLLLDHAARDARLVRHHDDRIPGSPEQSNGLEAPRVEPQPLESIDVPDVLDERPVTIEEHGRGRHGRTRVRSGS